MNDSIKKLKDNPQVYYIYLFNNTLFGVKEIPETYIIVAEDSFKLPSDLKNCFFFPLSKWFNDVLKGLMTPWMCACINKKYIIKEHVKLTMSTNPLQLRKNFEQYKMDMFSLIDDDIESNKYTYWNLINNLKLTNQIIENHKIANFKVASNDYNELYKCTDLETLKETFHSLFLNNYKLLKKSTDSLLQKEKIEKWNKEKEN